MKHLSHLRRIYFRWFFPVFCLLVLSLCILPLVLLLHLHLLTTT